MPTLLETNKLAVYLQDHLAGATGGLELARRTYAANHEGELGAFLKQLTIEMDEDRKTLIEVMNHFGIQADRLKLVFAWTGEKLGRLKPNGQLTGYSPLSRLVELDGLHLVTAGKLALWENVQAALGEHLVAFDLDHLIARANQQLGGLHEHRRAAAMKALELSG